MRIILSKENDEILYNLKSLYGFKNEGIAPRIAFALSLQSGKYFDLENENIPKSDGKEFRDDKALFGTLINDTSNIVIYKSILDQHYNKTTFEDEFVKLFKLHLNHGLKIWNESVKNGDITKGNHIDVLLKPIKKGLTLRSNTTHISTNIKKSEVKEFQDLLSFEIGKSENNDPIVINVNDLREFDNRNIAIAGMAGSGKTQLMKDILYQISKNSNNELKFIFFDYKGEGNPEQLKPFLDATKTDFVDIVIDGGVNFNPFLSINLEERQRPFSIRAFVDTISTFVPRMGVSQENILISTTNRQKLI
ncbi:DndE family protein [Daejeonia sp. YH14]|uniref:DndE family protein n=1 Tax=Daejeonia sp. YH14 TaxID=3439042 RepID=UPI003F492719